MRIDIDNVARVVAVIRWGLLGIAAVFLFVFDWYEAGMLVLLTSLVFSFALRVKTVRIWVVGKLTGIDPQVLRAAYDSDTAVSVTPVQATPAPRPVNPALEERLRYYRDPVPMLDKDIRAIVDATAEPAIRLVRHWPPHTPSDANSWLGGVPNLPDGVAWPVDPGTGLALHHLGQIDLSEMPLPDDTPLPSQGMLWFFADIGVDMDWAAGPNASTKVVFHPASTKGGAPAAVPETLPFVDHDHRAMTAQSWGFSGRPQKVYARWPVTGHATMAWPFSDDLPDGVTDPQAFGAACRDKFEALKTDITGPKVERDWRTPLVRSVTHKTMKRADGSEYVHTVQGDYDPTLHGGHFPYNTRLGVLTLHYVLYDLRKNANRFAQDETGDRRTQSEVLTAQIEPLLAHLERADPLATLGADDQAVFDGIMAVTAQVNAPAAILNITGIAVTELVAEAMETPALLDAVPDAVVDYVHETVLPSHHYTEHFLTGPKGTGTNPTHGTGIRLAQFDSDYALRMMFCDCGIIDFWIDPDDLAAGRWDKAWGATAGG